MAAIERIVVPGLARLPQFAHATRAGNEVYVAGTLGTCDGHLVDGGVGAETSQVIHNIGLILGAAGCAWDDVASVSVYLKDFDDFAAMNEVYDGAFSTTPPARITVGGVDLAMGARVEMQCVAHRTSTAPTAVPELARRSGYVQRDGERLYYEVVGEGERTPLVFCHGAGGNHAVWFQQVAHFARDRVVVTWDHRGYGRSSDHGDRTGPLVAVDDLLAILDELGIEHADLVGQSMGGWSAVGAALARPTLARSLVLTDTIGGLVTAPIAAGLARARVRDPERDVLGAHPALGQDFSARFPELAHLYQSLGRMGSADADVVFDRLRATTYGTEEAARLAMPVLLIVGDHDQIFPPAAIRAVADLLGDARVIEIVGAGHSPYYEEPATWNRTVDAFLDWLDRRDAHRR